MLRRRFLVVLGSLVALLMVAAVTAILLLNDAVKDLDALGAESLEGTNLILRLNINVTTLNAELNLLGGHHSPNAGIMAAALDSAAEQMAALGRLGVVQQGGPGGEAFGRLEEKVAFVRSAAAGLDPESGHMLPELRSAALALLPSIRAELAVLDEALHVRLEEDRRGLVRRFRYGAVGLGAVFVLVINISVIMIARAMNMVVKPVDSLVEASRRLAREEFGHRVELERDDEFGELARAYNSLAQQLQANEQRKIEVMHQVARTLSHELNNAMSVIELQLAMMARSPACGGDAAQPERLKQIRESLGRISRTVAALTQVRRIVLTDYLAGISMLDLEESVREHPPAPHSAAPAVQDT